MEAKVPFKMFPKNVPLPARHSLSYIDSSEVAYRICEETLKSKISEAHNRILCNLIGFSMELSLKAYILSKDYSEDTQKHIITHNLENLLKIASEKGLSFIEKVEEESLGNLNKYYKDSGSRYYTEKTTQKEPFFYFDPCQISDYITIIKKINKETRKIAKSLKNNKI